MKKNIIIITLIIILPIIAYVILSGNQTTAVAVSDKEQAKVIKFSSKLCLDCQKIKKCFDSLTPKYQDKITIIEYDVQSTEQQVKDALEQYNIQLVPTVVYIDKNGKEQRRTEGYVEKNKLEEYFNELLK